MLSSLDSPIVVFVAESNGCIKQVLLKWAQKSQQLVSIRITQTKLRGHATKNIRFTQLSVITGSDCCEVTVCTFLIQLTWSHFQRTYNKSIIEQTSWMFLWQCSLCSIIHHRNMRAVEITGTEDRHDVHVLYKWMEPLTKTVHNWQEDYWCFSC